MIYNDSRKQKQELLKQKGHCIWLTGLPGSGKTTIALALERLLLEHSILTNVFDGDIIRSNINADLDFSEAGRMQNIIRVAHLNTALISCGLVVINAFVSPLNTMRKKAIEIIGRSDFTLIFIDCSQKECEKRDPKGMYAKARKGMINSFTGISSNFEVPENSDLIIPTEKLTIEETTSLIYNFVYPLIKPSKLS